MDLELSGAGGRGQGGGGGVCFANMKEISNVVADGVTIVWRGYPTTTTRVLHWGEEPTW